MVSICNYIVAEWGFKTAFLKHMMEILVQTFISPGLKKIRNAFGFLFYFILLYIYFILFFICLAIIDKMHVVLSLYNASTSL